jgi:hypothetical protein
MVFGITSQVPSTGLTCAPAFVVLRVAFLELLLRFTQIFAVYAIRVTAIR